eukprot:3990626-Prorocentrum_lima.AAC.1
MAAVVATLLDLSWVPVSPTLWKTDRGEEIRLDRGGIEPLRLHLRHALRGAIWRRAAQHYEGQGAEH